MKKILVISLVLLASSQAVNAAPTAEQYSSRVRAEKLLKAEIAGDGSKMTSEQAQQFSNQIIESLKTINANQIKKGMTCAEIKEYVDATLGKKLEGMGTDGVMFQVGKYIEADCAVQKAWAA